MKFEYFLILFIYQLCLGLKVFEIVERRIYIECFDVKTIDLRLEVENEAHETLQIMFNQKIKSTLLIAYFLRILMTLITLF